MYQDVKDNRGVEVLRRRISFHSIIFSAKRGRKERRSAERRNILVDFGVLALPVLEFAFQKRNKGFEMDWYGID